MSVACGRPDKGVPAATEAKPVTITEATSEVVEAPTPEPIVELRIPVIEVPEAPPPPKPNLNARLGRFKITYYWVANEPSTSKGQVAIVDRSCKRLAKVSKTFRKKLQLEGSGRLKDGRMISKAGGCKCGSPCYWVTGEEHSWGSGVANRPLKPFRSIAVDPKEVRIGSSLYVAELDGLTMPGAGGEGGFVHDGCVVADDRGGGVRGKQIDLFAARREHYYNFFSRNKITRVNVYKGGKRCSAKSRAASSTLAARGGAI